jgi:TatD DNase family protein
MNLVDAHCHLHMDDYEDDRQEVIQKAKDQGIIWMVTVGIDLADSEKALTLARDDPSILCTVGIHPHAAGKVGERDFQMLEDLAREGEVVAVGETGLDYYRDLSPRDVQREVFLRQMGVAKAVGKPLVIHCRDAYGDLIRLMRRHEAREIGGVIHCFSGDWPSAKAFLDIGFFLSFAGPLTYPQARRLREIFQRVPEEMILMETDAPFLAPQPLRGKRNEPAFVVHTYREGARLKGLELKEWGPSVTENFRKAFRLS